MTVLRKIRLIAVDCDGVLIEDSYLSVIERFVLDHAGTYDEAAERAIIGGRDLDVAEQINELCGLAQPPADTLAALYAAREDRLRTRPLRLLDGAQEFLAGLRELNVRIVCYGGRSREHTFDRHLGGLLGFLDPEIPYIEVNDHRPGVDWIVRHVIGCAFDEAVFIDDVNRVAEACRDYGAGFVGFPSSPAHRRQRAFMAATGVRYLVSALDEIVPGLVATVDAELAAGNHWS